MAETRLNCLSFTTALCNRFSSTGPVRLSAANARRRACTCCRVKLARKRFLFLVFRHKTKIERFTLTRTFEFRQSPTTAGATRDRVRRLRARLSPRRVRTCDEGQGRARRKNGRRCDDEEESKVVLVFYRYIGRGDGMKRP